MNSIINVRQPRLFLTHFIICYLFICIDQYVFSWFLGSTAHGFVNLSGNQNVKRFSNVRLNCSSNSRPFANTASIQVDGKSYTAITLQNGNCFSSVLGKYCTPNVCECSNRGLWYSHTHKVAQHIGVVNFTCLMTFEGYGSFTDSITVKIIGKPNFLLSVRYSRMLNKY